MNLVKVIFMPGLTAFGASTLTSSAVVGMRAELWWLYLIAVASVVAGFCCAVYESRRAT